VVQLLDALLREQFASASGGAVAVIAVIPRKNSETQRPLPQKPTLSTSWLGKITARNSGDNSERTAKNSGGNDHNC
jgi:hypothetical protein